MDASVITSIVAAAILAAPFFGLAGFEALLAWERFEKARDRVLTAAYYKRRAWHAAIRAIAFAIAGVVAIAAVLDFF